MASLVMGVAGAAVGFIVGGPAGAQVGFALGSMAGGALFPPKGPDGPRLGELTVQASTYGNAIPIPYGAVRLAGNVIWAADIVEHVHEEGGGSGGPTYTTYSYTASFAVAICAGPIAGVTRIWADGLLIYDIRPERTGEAIGFKAGGHKLYLGTETQLPDPTIEAVMLTTPAYRGLAYWVFTDLELARYGNRLPSLSFEVVTSANADLPPASVFGENYNMNPADGADKFEADLDPATGHLWLNTMSGHARYDAASGAWVIDPTMPGVPQVQEYDPVTQQLLWAYDVPVVTEYWSSGMQQIITVHHTYRIGGSAVFSGGWYFIGRGEPAIPLWWHSEDTPATVYGLAINAGTHQVIDLTSVCSQQQFQGAFYWPGTPVPVIDNNKVYLAGNNGLDGGFAVGFMPASIAANPYGDPPTFSDTDPVPTTSGGMDSWNVLAGWTQARAKGAPCALDGFDGVAIGLPGWALKATVLTHPNAVIVQGYGGVNGSGSNYVSWVSSPRVSGFDLTPAEVHSVGLPGSTVVMPPIAWDQANQTLWAFTGAAYGSYGSLYAITRAAGGELTASYTGFSFPPGSVGQFRPDDVKAMTIDSATGMLRLVVGGGFNEPASLVLLDPVNQVEIDRQPITLTISYTRGRLWDLPAENKVIYADGYYIYDIPYAATLAARPVALGAIVQDLSVRAGLLDTAIDVGELTDMVDGYAVTHRMAARSAIEPLQQAYFFDAVESDYKIKFKKRGRARSAQIPDADLAAHLAGQPLPELVETRRQQELDLPQQVNVKYTNPAADYQTSTQYEARLTGRSQLAMTIELPLVLTDAKARQIAGAALYSAWAERTSVKFATSIKYAALEPADVALVHGRLLRLVRRKQTGLLLEWEAFADGNTQYATEALAQPGTGVAAVAVIGQSIPAIPGTRLLLLDIPLLQDSDAAPGFYMAAQGEASGWRGAQVWRSTDDGTSYAPMASIALAATIGSASNALGLHAGGDTFDEANVLRVVLPASSAVLTLASAPESQVLAGANAALVGNEILQYKRAVLQDDGSYLLSGLLRARRGTSQANHQAGERFVALTGALVRQSAQTSEIGLPRLYKAVSSGGTLATAAAVPLTDTEQALRPYAPCLLGGGFDASGNALLRWVRRSRLDASWRDGVDAALGESTEAYEVEIWDAGFATLKRTIAGLASPAATYTAAQQVLDFGEAQATVYFKAYQLSAQVGRGFAAQGQVGTAAAAPAAPLEPLADGELATVQAAVDGAAIGDTVLIPAGTWDWGAGTLYLPAGIYVRGAGKTATIIQRSANPLGRYFMIEISGSNGLAPRLSDMTLEGINGATLAAADYGIGLVDDCVDFNLYNLRLTKFSWAAIYVGESDTQRGVIHHCDLVDNYNPAIGNLGYGIAVYGGGSYGALALGTQQAVFVENNYFRGQRHEIASNNGSRYVFRYNNVVADDRSKDFASVDAHGLSSSPVGSRSYEIYGNNFSSAVSSGIKRTAIGLRGGDGVVWGNTIPDSFARAIELMVEGFTCGTIGGTNGIANLHIWGNTINPNLAYTATGIDNTCSGSIRPGTELVLAAPAGYSAYPYPHPLAGA